VADERAGKSEGGERKPFSTVEAQFLAAGEAMDGSAEGAAEAEGAQDETQPGWSQAVRALLRRRAREIAAGIALMFLIVGALWDDSRASFPTPVLAVRTVAPPISARRAVISDPSASEPSVSAASVSAASRSTPAPLDPPRRSRHHKAPRRSDARR
jgi:hypothetical protein